LVDIAVGSAPLAEAPADEADTEAGSEAEADTDAVGASTPASQSVEAGSGAS
ncbi:MAG: hypothetical protein QOG60_1262, partial [Frankiaceae bacterium]|nr:hypothetical protein [Frankiaceae bacterium]